MAQYNNPARNFSCSDILDIRDEYNKLKNNPWKDSYSHMQDVLHSEWAASKFAANGKIALRGREHGNYENEFILWVFSDGTTDIDYL